jgi:MoxR-like ATPase
VKKYLNFGASVRGIQNIILASKARALMNKRYHVAFEDVAAMAVPVLRHRVLVNFHAESDKVTADAVLRKMIDSIPVPRD